MNAKRQNQRYDSNGNPIKFYDEDDDYWTFPDKREDGWDHWEGSEKEL